MRAELWGTTGTVHAPTLFTSWYTHLQAAASASVYSLHPMGTKAMFPPPQRVRTLLFTFQTLQ